MTLPTMIALLTRLISFFDFSFKFCPFCLRFLSSVHTRFIPKRNVPGLMDQFTFTPCKHFEKINSDCYFDHVMSNKNSDIWCKNQIAWLGTLLGT